MDSTIVLSGVFSFRETEKFLFSRRKFQELSVRFLGDHKRSNYLDNFEASFIDLIDFESLSITLPLDHYPEEFWPLITDIKDYCDTGHLVFIRENPSVIGCWVDGLDIEFDNSNISEIINIVDQGNAYFKDLITLTPKDYEKKYYLSDRRFELTQLLENLKPSLLNLWAKEHGYMVCNLV